MVDATTFDDVRTLADLLDATRAALSASRPEGRKLDSVLFMRELGQANAIAQEAKHLDAAHVTARLSAASPTTYAIAEQANLLTHPGFIKASCTALAALTKETK